MTTGDGTEKIVPREEAPVDVNAKAGPRVVFPPLNPNGNPPSAASVAPGNLPPPNSGNGTLPNTEPRRVRTMTVKATSPTARRCRWARRRRRLQNRPRVPEPRLRPRPQGTTRQHLPMPARMRRCRWLPQGEPGGTGVRAPDPGGQHQPGANSAGSPHQPAAATWSRFLRSAARPTPRPPSGPCRANSRAVLGSHSPSIKRADLGEKGVYYRAMVGPFGTSEEASQFCGNLKSAGGQCVVQRN